MMNLTVFLTVLCSAIGIVELGSLYPGQLKIVGGHDADISSFPWQVSLLDDKSFFICGGVLISKTWVLTTASTMAFYRNRTITIRAGSSSWKSGGQTVDVKNKIIHTNPNPDKPENNLALLELVSPVTTSSAKPATLYSENVDIKANTTITVIGWGRINASANFYPETLKAVEVSVLNKNGCKARYMDKYNVTENMFCSSAVGGRSACAGDQGGSASIEKVVVGITNGWGISCAVSSSPAIFMRVAAYRDWIKSVAGI